MIFDGSKRKENPMMRTTYSGYWLYGPLQSTSTRIKHNTDISPKSMNYASKFFRLISTITHSMKDDEAGLQFSLRKKFDLTSRSLMIKAVNKGVKHLVFENLLKRRLQEHNIPDQCEVISAGFAFSIHSFKTIRYDEMPILVDALLSDGLLMPSEGSKECHLLDALRELNPWFEKLHTTYDVVGAEDSMPEASPQPRKRARPDSHAPEYQVYQQSQSVYPATTLDMNSIGEQASMAPSRTPVDTMEANHVYSGSTTVPNTLQLGSRPLVQHGQTCPLGFANPFLSVNSNACPLPGVPNSFPFEQRLLAQTMNQPYDCESIMRSSFDACLNSPRFTNAKIFGT